MAGPAGSVLLLHGAGRTGLSMQALAAAVRRAGYTPSTPSYPYRRPLDEIVAGLVPRLDPARNGGPLHIVTHSMGGLVALALLAAHRPGQLGRVVMLAPPLGGSGLADRLHAAGLDRLMLGRAGALLTSESAARAALLARPPDYELGVIAGDRVLLPIGPALLAGPNDGKVCVSATRIEGLADHLVLPVPHTTMPGDREVIGQALHFLAQGRFRR